MKWTNILMVITSLVVLFSCGSESSKQKSIDTAQKVETIAVKQYEVLRPQTISGTISADESADLSTKLMGTIEMLKVKPGDKVKRGALLVKIENKELRASLSTANAALEQVVSKLHLEEKNYGRMTRLLAEESITQGEFDKVSMELQVTKEQLTQAKAQVEKVKSLLMASRIVAPFNGVITNKFVKQGSYATPGHPILSIANTNVYNVVFFLPEDQSMELHEGEVCEVSVRDSSTKLTATVTHIAATGTYHNGQIRVVAKIEEKVSELGDGIYATVRLPNMKSQQIVIPKTALVRYGALTGVYKVAENGRALLQWIRLGETYEEKWCVISGLDEGAVIVNNPSVSLRDGDKISTNRLN
ncbi:efflux RND transporter periplasmic adaptor subunit [Halosquirtibacter xylanolyticus]|uniref:efflux RND transporter periplasmic adaptor subunit n=1 Tax=Halosquirtibacter xylanolyticus TaxID=3374599 RepID=UPI0037480D3A|nr:efflux RND transporter periplasmic adaptor subunit [Prolixibacteraceae bacterium]